MSGIRYNSREETKSSFLTDKTNEAIHILIMIDEYERPVILRNSITLRSEDHISNIVTILPCIILQ